MGEFSCVSRGQINGLTKLPPRLHCLRSHRLHARRHALQPSASNSNSAMATVGAACAAAPLIADAKSSASASASASAASSPCHLLRVSNLRSSASASAFFRARLHRTFTPLFHGSHGSRCILWKSPVSEQVAVDGSSNAAAGSAPTVEMPSSEVKEVKPVEESPSASAMTDSDIAIFMNEVASLVKLVDSRDIVELQLKQNDCELLIRKKEALPQPPTPPPPVMVHAPYPAPSHLPPAPVQAVPPPPSSALVPAAPTQSAPAAKTAKSGIPPLKSPMAGTFYRCPGPGEPPFVKVGDKVQKGQVLCIVEAMKLMNEIEADKSGTIAEIIAEDCKPVSVDTPLFVIQA